MLSAVLALSAGRAARIRQEYSNQAFVVALSQATFALIKKRSPKPK